MATHLKQEAYTHLYENEELRKKVAPHMGISEAGVMSAVIRRSSSLLNIMVVYDIAASMKVKNPLDLVEDITVKEI